MKQIWHIHNIDSNNEKKLKHVVNAFYNGSNQGNNEKKLKQVKK